MRVAEKFLPTEDQTSGIQNNQAFESLTITPDGRQTIIVASDNNFNNVQQTQFLALTIAMETIPTISPVTETPDEIRFGDSENPDLDNALDADDPAIYVNPNNPEDSFVIATFKDGGLRVYDLAGEEIQSITPGNVDDNSPFPSSNNIPENISYNNVDIAYGVEYFGQLAGSSETIDFAVVSDRANDTVAFFAINPETKQLTKWDEGFEFPESIFGVDDGEATAYGLATYNSPVDGKSYVFVSQADGDRIAQLEFSATFGAADEPIVNAEVVRTFAVPVPEGADPEDAQIEGMVVDRETGDLYLAQENFGIWKVSAELDGSNELTLVDTVTEETDSSQVPYSNLVVFGDSLSDTGNVFNATDGLIPPPPYFEGRFSNGDLLVEAIASELELPDSQPLIEGGSNYAFGSAQTGEGSAEFGLLGDLPATFEVPNLGQQVDLYLSGQTPTETDLFYVYGGGNDFIDPLLRGEALPTSEEIVGNITSDITELAEAGAQAFVVPNLPPLGEIPLFNQQPEATAILNNATDEFNQLLDTELDAIASELDVTIIEPDINSIVTEIQNNPGDFGLTNTTDAVFDTTNLSLAGNPEEFFYWDTFHPTATATDIIAQEVINVLPGSITGETPPLVPDVEGLTIYYGEDGNGYLVASSQGNSTFAIYDRAGSNSYLGSFAVEDVEETEGIDVTNVPLGEDYPAGLLVVQDSSNESAVVFADPSDGEMQNFNTNFKYVSLIDFADTFPNLPPYDPNAFDPRNPEDRTSSDLASCESDAELTPVFGTLEADTIDVTGTENLVFTGEGDDTVNVAEGNNRTDKPHNDIYGDAGDDAFFLGIGDYVVGGEGSDQFWVANGELPDTPIRIADFELGSDVVGFSNLGISSDDLTITQNGDDASIAIAGTEVAILSGVDANASFDSSFAFA